VSQAVPASLVTPEWSPGDDYFSDGELPGTPSTKRPRSIESSAESLTARLSRRFPSISARWRDRKHSLSMSGAQVQSAPPTRANSTRVESIRRSAVPGIDPYQTLTPPITPVDAAIEPNVLAQPRRLSRAQKPVDIVIPDHKDENYDSQELATTPLLPPMVPDYMVNAHEVQQSPLQSPSVAGRGSTTSLIGTPSMTPTNLAQPTPPLSSKPSMSSFNVGRPMHAALQPASEIPQMSITDEYDPWAARLGHANFHITPEPYMPAICDLPSCKRLLDDWEVARREYMQQASRVSEHHGPTSQIYKFTEQKWAEIDNQWRACHEQASKDAGISAESFQPLAETQPLSKPPSLTDPQTSNNKFHGIDEAHIVGPMVQYAKIQRRPSRKPTFLKLFTDPASLLGGRAPFGIRR
jgi:hypothetical protein